MMSLEEVTVVLQSFKELSVPDSRITCLRPAENQKVWYGADYPQKYIVWEHETQKEAVYWIKRLRIMGHDLPSVVCELICARIGRQLFPQSLCPPYAIADPLPGKRERGFGSKDLAGYCLERLDSDNDLQKVKNIDPTTLARIIVYHLWLVAYDAEILIHENGKEAFSIDHGFFLWWHKETLQKDLYSELLAVLDEKEIESALNELENIDQKRVIEQFAFIPKNWGMDMRSAAYLAWRILQRKAEVRTTIATMRKQRSVGAQS